MKIETAKRLNGIGEYYFSRKMKEIEALGKTGDPVINLGIGSPDLPPHPEVIRSLIHESVNENLHGYQSYRGSDLLRTAFARWYSKWYDVALDPLSEVLPLMGSKEGIMHVCMTYLNEGDFALIPNPGYPAYRAAVKLAGANCLEYQLKEDENWQIDFSELEKMVRSATSKVRLMWINYPHMPTGRTASEELFVKLVGFAKKHGILLCNDNPYGFILNDNRISLLAVEGAMEVGIELNSLSKSHNMAGWRIGVLCGSKDRINEILQFKSNMDSGMFLPLQIAAANALRLDEDWYAKINKTYGSRRNKAFELLDLLNCSYHKQQAGMFVWAKIPDKYKQAEELCDNILSTAKVFISPGMIFGSAGQNYIRVSLCNPVEKFDESIARIQNHFLS